MARPVVLGLDCAMYYMTATNRAASNNATALGEDTWAAALTSAFDAGAWDEITPITEVTLNLTTATADVTTRASGGYRQTVPTLKDASVDFSILWKPDDEVFTELLARFMDQCPVAMLVLDGQVTNITNTSAIDVDVTRCTNSGRVTGLYADMAITSFTRNEGLEDAVMADLSLVPTIGLVTPEWISVTDQ